MCLGGWCGEGSVLVRREGVQEEVLWGFVAAEGSRSGYTLIAHLVAPSRGNIAVVAVGL